MRIIAGKYRGKQLFSPQIGEVRPTSDRAREALFNILNSKLGGNWQNVTFLDVFAGTGAIGFEALSRGAEKVAFVDINTANLLKNTRLFPDEKQKIEVYKAKAENLPSAGGKFNLIFLDAPYNKGLSEPALSELRQKGWIDDDALIVVETEKNEKLDTPSVFELVDQRIYGPALFRFFRIAA